MKPLCCCDQTVVVNAEHYQRDHCDLVKQKSDHFIELQKEIKKLVDLQKRVCHARTVGCTFHEPFNFGNATMSCRLCSIWGRRNELPIVTCSKKYC